MNESIDTLPFIIRGKIASERIPELLDTVAAMAIRVEIVVQYNEGLAEPAAEVDVDDVRLHKSDFADFAEEIDATRDIATRSWTALTTPFNEYTETLRALDRVKPVSWHKHALARPEWMRDVCIEPGILSYKHLRKLVDNEQLREFDNLGPKCEVFITRLVESRKPAQ